jgi:hypothetical protein
MGMMSRKRKEYYNDDDDYKEKDYDYGVSRNFFFFLYPPNCRFLTLRRYIACSQKGKGGMMGMMRGMMRKSYKDSDYKDGDYKDSDYSDSDYKDDDYKDSDYKDGDYKDGDYKDGDYKDGDYKDGDYKDGDYKDDADKDGEYGVSVLSNCIVQSQKHKSFRQSFNTNACIVLSSSSVI